MYNNCQDGRVTLESSIKLRSLGFNEVTSKYFNSNKDSVPFGIFGQKTPRRNSWLSKCEFSQPTFNEALNWIYANHGLCMIIVPLYNNPGSERCRIKILSQFQDSVIWEANDLFSYEEGRNLLLETALAFAAICSSFSRIK